MEPKIERDDMLNFRLYKPRSTEPFPSLNTLTPGQWTSHIEACKLREDLAEAHGVFENMDVP